MINLLGLLYKFLLRNRERLYESIKVEFRQHRDIDKSSPKGQLKIQMALEGLKQLHRFDGFNVVADMEYTMDDGSKVLNNPAKTSPL